MTTHRLAVLLCLLAMGPLGCSVENAPSRKEVAEQRAAAYAENSVPAPPKFMPPSNDAQRVLEACGRPESDTVTPIYDKLHNGPVRRMIYHGRQVMELEFIPVGLDVRPGERAPAYAPPGTMWRFQSAHMQNREFVTSRHFDIYLPCAKRALADEL